MKYLLILLLCPCMGFIGCGDESGQPDIDYATIEIHPEDRVASNQSILVIGDGMDIYWMSIGGVEGTAEAIPVLPAPVVSMWHPEQELPLGIQPRAVKWWAASPGFGAYLSSRESFAPGPPETIEVVAPDYILPRLTSSEPADGDTIAAATARLHTTFSELIGRIEHASLVSGETVHELGPYIPHSEPELLWVVELQPATEYRLVLRGIYDFAWNRTEEVTVSFHTSD